MNSEKNNSEEKFKKCIFGSVSQPSCLSKTKSSKFKILVFHLDIKITNQ